MTRYLVLVALIMGSVAAPVAAAPADAGARLAMVSYRRLPDAARAEVTSNASCVCRPNRAPRSR